MDAGPESDSSKFYYKMLDLAMYQQVTEITRFRQGQQSSMLDYVFTDEENMIELINYEVPLGKSDHICMNWTVKVERLIKQENQTKLTIGKETIRRSTKRLQQLIGSTNFKTVL